MVNYSRRGFLQGLGALSGALYLGGCSKKEETPANPSPTNPQAPPPPAAPSLTPSGSGSPSSGAPSGGTGSTGSGSGGSTVTATPQTITGKITSVTKYDNNKVEFRVNSRTVTVDASQTSGTITGLEEMLNRRQASGSIRLDDHTNTSNQYKLTVTGFYLDSKYNGVPNQPSIDAITIKVNPVVGYNKKEFISYAELTSYVMKQESRLKELTGKDRLDVETGDVFERKDRNYNERVKEVKKIVKYGRLAMKTYVHLFGTVELDGKQGSGLVEKKSTANERVDEKEKDSKSTGFVSTLERGYQGLKRDFGVPVLEGYRGLFK